MSVALAPAAVVRAAAWPLATLDAFGGSRMDCGSLQFAASYAEALQRERAALWERTAGDPRFMTALALASPVLFERVVAGRREPRNKRVRHLETSLYRYLARAALRTTPNGLWAGTAIASFDESDAIRSQAARARFTPELSIFAAALRALGERVAYQDAARYRLNPTLRADGEGGWQFVARGADGEVELRDLAPDRALASCLARLAEHGTDSLRGLSGAANTPIEVLRALADGGVLVGGLGLPARFTSPWQALAVAGEQLPGAARSVLAGAVEALKGLADELGSAVDVADPYRLPGPMAQARSVLAGLMRALGVDVPAPERPFRCDLQLPCAISLGPGRRAALTAAIAAYDREWIAGASPLSARRRALREGLMRAIAQRSVPFGEALPWSSEAPGADTSAWASSFAGGRAEARLAAGARASGAALAPWGCATARLGPQGPSLFFGVDDSPTRVLARHAAQLGGADDLVAWVRAQARRLADECGVTLAELAIPHAANPNVLARPDFGLPALEPWGAEGLALAGAELGVRGESFLMAMPGVGPLVALSLSSANVLRGDPGAEALALTGFCDPADPELRATGLLHPDELAAPRHAPRLALSSGLTIRERRTCLHGELLARLTSQTGMVRFASWCALVDRFGWPEQVTLRLDDGPPLFVPTSSPLAVEAALEGAGAARLMIVEDVTPTPWLATGAGLHVADVMLPFTRERHALSR